MPEIMKIHYVLLVHKNPKQIRRLIKALESECAYFYIHVDRNVSIDAFYAELSAVENVRWVQRREASTWGDIGLVRATLYALTQIVNECKTGYCILLSGQDYPIRANTSLEHFLRENNGTSFIEIFPIPTEKWLHSYERIHYYKLNYSSTQGDYFLCPSLLAKDFYSNVKENLSGLWKLIRRKKAIPLILFKKRVFPTYIKPHGGSQWWAFTIDTARSILLFIEKHPDYLRYHKYTLVPDEIFFHSILMHLFKENPDSDIRPSLTYVNWSRKDVQLPVTFRADDITELNEQARVHFFARKFDMSSDPEILDLLDQRTAEKHSALI